MIKLSIIPANIANTKNVTTTRLFTSFCKSLNIFSGESITGNCNNKNLIKMHSGMVNISHLEFYAGEKITNREKQHHCKSRHVGDGNVGKKVDDVAGNKGSGSKTDCAPHSLFAVIEFSPCKKVFVLVYLNFIRFKRYFLKTETMYQLSSNEQFCNKFLV